MKVHHRNRCSAVCFVLAALLLFLTVPVFAAGMIEPERAVSLTLRYASGEDVLSGVRVHVYRVADISAAGEYVLTGDFRAYPVSFDDLDSSGWAALAGTLSGYVRRDALTPDDSGVTDADGTVSFPSGQNSMQAGLYLILSDTLSMGGAVYTQTPYLLLLPCRNTAGTAWVYDVTASPKIEKEVLPPEPSDETITRRVLKVWEDDGKSELRPTSVSVDLLCDGMLYDTVQLTAEGNWRHTWEGLSRYRADGSTVLWQVVEHTVNGYTVSVTQEGITFVVKNTVIPPEEPSSETTEPVPPPDTEPVETEPIETEPIEPPDTEPAGPVETEPVETEPTDTTPVTPPDTEPEPTADTSPVEPPDTTEILPQTGMLWWPVPVLFALGIGCLCLGFFFREGKPHA